MSAELTSLDIQAKAADFLLDKRENKDWGTAEEQALQHWLDAALAHRIAYWRLDAAWNRADLLGAIRRPPLAQHRPKISHSRWPALLRGVAAAMLVLGLVLGLSYAMLPYLSSAPDKTYATAVGEREKLTLADGSQIELNTNTLLRTQISMHHRQIWLEKGEVYFDVKNGDKFPFVVMVDGHRITDIGTKFVIRRDSGHFQVTVLEGKVQIEGDKTSARKLLGKGDVALAANGKISLNKISPDALVKSMGWQRGVLIFDQMTLAAAAAEFNRYNHKKLIVTPSAAGITLDGTFPSNNVDAFIRLAKGVLRLNIEDRGSEIVVSK